MRPMAWVLGIVLVWGAVKLPWEDQMDRQRREIVHGEDIPLTPDTRDLLGQELSLALLGGFRGLAATMTWISLTGAWEDKEWTRVRALADLSTTLQPKMLTFWEQGAWHLAWNASIDAEKYSGYANPSRAEVESRMWIRAGEEMLKRGLKVHPTKANLYLRLGEIYWQRLEDYDEAAEYYRLASLQEDAPGYAERFVAYALEKAGREEEAYAVWKELWPQAVERQVTQRSAWQNARQRVMEMEKKLDVPMEERIFPTD